jgi:hypothetical protein
MKLGALVFLFIFCAKVSVMAEPLFETYTKGQKIPNNIKELRKFLGQKVKDDLRLKHAPSISTVIIPDSRSLQRANSTFAHPREVTMISSAPSMKPDPAPFYLGFAPLAEQVEVISWNPQVDRYEFLILEKFAPHQEPVLKVANRNFCMSCHQHGGPIFSHQPWSETENNSTLLTKVNEVRREAGLKEFGQQFEFFKPDENLEEILGGVGAIDNAVRHSAIELQKRKICRNLCGQDLECRKRLLTAAILSASERVSDLKNFKETFASYLEKRWPRDGFAYPTSVLLNRDPMDYTELGGTTETYTYGKASDLAKDTGMEEDSLYRFNSSIALLAKIKLSPTFIEDTSFFGKFLSGISLVKKITGIKDEADPAFARPKLNGFYPESAFKDFVVDRINCFGLRWQDFSELKTYEVNELVRIGLESPLISKLLSHWPPRREDIMFAVRTELGTQNSAVITDQMTSIDVLQPAAPIFEKPASLFIKYCSNCHSESDSISLPLDDIKGLKAYRFIKNGINWSLIDRLKGLPTVMPPPGTDIQPTTQERRLMIEMLNN